MMTAAAQNPERILTSRFRPFRQLRMRVVLVLALAFVACSNDDTTSSNIDMAVQDAAPICTGDLAPVKHAPTACGPMTCPADKICMIFTPGIGPAFDAGNGYSYSCEDLPADCTCAAAGCGAQSSPPGCFRELCQGEPTCRFDGATLTCFGI